MFDAVNGMRVAKLKNHSPKGSFFHFFMHTKNPPQKYCDMPFAIRDEYIQRKFVLLLYRRRESATMED
jgi:hypothetical protein